MVQVTAREIAEIVEGEIFGKEDVIVSKASKIEDADPESICFLANTKYENHLYNTQASIVVVDNNFEPKKPIKSTLIKVSSAYLSFAKILEHFFNPYNNLKGIHSKHIAKSAAIGENVYIGANVVIEPDVTIGNNTKILANAFIGKGSSIGQNCVLYAGVSLYHDVKLGNECIIHSGVVIGSDGFGHAPMPDGSYYKIPQVGNVTIEDKVEIGANCTIDRATMGSTIIKKGTKLDNLVQIAHNVELGKNIVIAAQAGVAGSSKIGNNSMIGGQAGIAGHIIIADGSQLAAQSGFSKSITEKNKKYFGSPAMPLTDFFKSFALFKKLPQIEKRLSKLEKNKR